mmetsp:Transcript_2071/g.4366  ORF Transcript_2071/g.4366 Transcript_2071/m.4366 type:complete len:432 (-) Transcript_2071:1848-3143(-)
MVNRLKPCALASTNLATRSLSSACVSVFATSINLCNATRTSPSSALRAGFSSFSISSMALVKKVAFCAIACTVLHSAVKRRSSVSSLCSGALAFKSAMRALRVCVSSWSSTSWSRISAAICDVATLLCICDKRVLMQMVAAEELSCAALTAFSKAWKASSEPSAGGGSSELLSSGTRLSPKLGRQAASAWQAVTTAAESASTLALASTTNSLQSNARVTSCTAACSLAILPLAASSRGSRFSSSSKLMVEFASPLESTALLSKDSITETAAPMVAFTFSSAAEVAVAASSKSSSVPAPDLAFAKITSALSISTSASAILINTSVAAFFTCIFCSTRARMFLHFENCSDTACNFCLQGSQTSFEATSRKSGADLDDFMTARRLSCFLNREWPSAKAASTSITAVSVCSSIASTAFTSSAVVSSTPSASTTSF